MTATTVDSLLHESEVVDGHGSRAVIAAAGYRRTLEMDTLVPYGSDAARGGIWGMCLCIIVRCLQVLGRSVAPVAVSWMGI